MLFWAQTGMTVIGFVCRNFSGHVRGGVGMFCASSWTLAQTGWVSRCLSLHDSCMTGLLRLGFCACTLECLCVCTYVWGKSLRECYLRLFEVGPSAILLLTGWRLFLFVSGTESTKRSGADAGGILSDDWLLSLQHHFSQWPAVPLHYQWTIQLQRKGASCLCKY